MTATATSRKVVIEVYACDDNLDLTNCTFEFASRMPTILGPQRVVIEHGDRPAVVGLWRIVPEPA